MIESSLSCLNAMINDHVIATMMLCESGIGIATRMFLYYVVLIII